MAKRDAFQTRRFVLLGVVCLCGLLGLIVAIAAGTRIAGGVLVQGQVKSSASNMVLQHETGGVVAHVHVADGAAVAAGQVLVTLETRKLDHRIAELTQRGEALDAALTRITALQTGQAPLWPRVTAPDVLAKEQKLHASWAETLRLDAAQLQADRRELEKIEATHRKKARALQRQADLIRDDLADQQRLRAMGVVAKNQLTAVTREAARLEGALAEVALSVQTAQIQFARAERRATSAQAQRTAQWAQEGLRLAQERLALQHQLEAALLVRQSQVVRAPTQGWIQTLRDVSPHSVIRAGEPILSLVPEGGDQRVVVAITPAQVTHVWAGQEVMVRFADPDAGNGQVVDGAVLRRSVDVRTGPDGQLHYEVHIQLRHNVPAKQHLVSGAPVEVLIKTADRTPFAILAAPIRNFFRRALRESEPGSFDPAQSTVASGNT